MVSGEVEVTCREVEHGKDVIDLTEATGHTFHRREHSIETFDAGVIGAISLLRPQASEATATTLSTQTPW